ncbi:MAG: ATP-binding cassette domain-containing protein [Ruminococcaceae bacterium]|nr:ATP-binding cassette domain-containing protein [Oscillospiraceae bacterium]
MTAKALKFQNVTLKYGKKVVLDNFSLTLPVGRFSAIMGASGIGKTSLLRLAAGLVPDKNFKGVVDTGGAIIAYQFQEPRLFPWLTVAENIAVVLESKNKPLTSAELRQKSLDLLELFGLADVADQYPDSLSGGMAQRVSLARTLAYDAELVLLDEPFRGLDGQTRADVMQKVRKALDGKTVILVTHDREEAEFFAKDNVFDL